MLSRAETEAWRAEGRRHVEAATEPADARSRNPLRWLVALAVTSATFFVVLVAAIGVQAGLGGDTTATPSLPGLFVVVTTVSLIAGLAAWFAYPGRTG